MFSPQVLDHFDRPRNAGDLTGADIVVSAENPACGDLMQLSLKISASRIEQIRFKAKGCVASVACGSALTELLNGKSIAEARQVSRQQIVDNLGGLTVETMHASHLAMDAWQSALKQWTDKK